MDNFGFYADIEGVKHFLGKDKNLAWDLILGLTDSVCGMCRAISSHNSDNIGRFVGHQMGDGFFLQFDSTKNEYGPCKGTADTLVMLAVVLAQRFLIKYQGILHIGIAKGEISGHSLHHLDTSNIGASVISFMPVTGTLLAETYSLTCFKIPVRQNYKYCPNVLISQDLYDSLSETRIKLSEVVKDKKRAWQYNKFEEPDNGLIELYRRIWPNEQLNSNSIKNALNKYNANNA